MTTRFAVDLDQLADVIADLTAQQERLTELAVRVDAAAERLHEQWEGRASAAHHGAHAQWRSGSARMRDALAAMTKAAATAERNYSGAAETNLRMWQEIS